jgi:hypothetical protein
MLAVEARSAPSNSASALAKLNCAGVGCPERDGCRRYETRIAVGKRVAKNGFEYKTYTWASFDVERELMGDCPSRIRQVVR